MLKFDVWFILEPFSVFFFFFLPFLFYMIQAPVHAGLDLLMGLLGSYYNPKQQLDGAVALCKLANKAATLSPVDAAPPSPTPQVGICNCWLVLILHSIIAKWLIAFAQYFDLISMFYLYMMFYYHILVFKIDLNIGDSV